MALSKISKALLKCCYSTDPKRDIQEFYNATTKANKMTPADFCSAVLEVVDYHTQPCSDLVKSVAKYLDTYKITVKKEPKELKPLREDMIEKISTYLRKDFRPKD